MYVDALHDNGISVPTLNIVPSPSPSPIVSCQDLGQCQWEACGKEGSCRDQDSHALGTGE